MKSNTFRLLAFVLSVLALRAYGQAIQIIPQPVEMLPGKGAFALTKTTTIAYNHPDAKAVADMLAQKLSAPTGFALKAMAGKTASIQLNLNDTPDGRIGKEGYVLDAGLKGVVLSANAPAGLFYGVQTLLQLLPKEVEQKTATAANWSIPVVKITDYPRFGWRGIMLDVSRHFFSKEDVKTYIDQIARYKYNTLHWHLTDDNGWRVEIKSLPKLTSVGAWRVERAGHFGDRANPKPGEPATYGGFYSHEDIREVIRYAAERHVTIVPEIDVPGHSMAAIAAYPELSCTKDTSIKVNPGTPFSEWYGNGTFKMLVDNTLNPSDEKVYAFLDKVFTEIAELFPNPYIHVGGDECYKGFWANDPGCQALMKKLNIRHVEDLQGYFMGRVEKILSAKGKKLLGWDEILEGGISPGATVMSWRGVKGGIEAAHLGHDVVMTPTTFAYLDYNQGEQTVDPPIYAGLRVSKSYSFEPVPDGVDAKHILGGQGNVWTEQIPTLRHLEYMTYPRAWALSEVYWSPKEAKNWGHFAQRMEAHFPRAEAARVNVSTAVYDAMVKTRSQDGKLLVEMGTELADLAVHYTIDDTMPDTYSPLYSAPFALPDGPITLRVQTFRNGKPIGHLITLKRADLERRAGR
jgi:hexosaminidase